MRVEYEARSSSVKVMPRSSATAVSWYGVGRFTAMGCLLLIVTGGGVSQAALARATCESDDLAGLPAASSARRLPPAPVSCIGGRGGRMDARDLFLEQHAAMHSLAVGGNRMSAAERTFTGLSDAQMRVRPREDLNSIAWIMFHIARAEDIFVNTLLSGHAQLMDDQWLKRLGITRRDFGIGMSS